MNPSQANQPPPERASRPAQAAAAIASRTHFLAGILWFVTILAGAALLFDYDTPSARSSPAPLHWPAATRVRFSDDHANLVIFLHPKCPCSRATISELETIQMHTSSRLSVAAVLLNPPHAPADWFSTALLDRLSAIPRVSVHTDVDGVEAERFGAAESGFVALYDPSGRLAFSGGITGSPGHVGDNDGRRAVIALAGGNAPHLKQTPVFGCSLATPPTGGTGE